MQAKNQATIAVHAAACRIYDQSIIDNAVAELLQATGFVPARSSRVLVKPNLLRMGNNGLPCTHPAVTAACCKYLLDHGAQVRIGDSPGFGRAERVAEHIGLSALAADLSVPIINLDTPRRIRLPFGYTAAVSAKALDNDYIVNVPKLKAHCQMRITAAVKNYFGCICGARKALAHTVHGDKGNRMESLIIEIMAVLPPGPSLLDGITAMHRNGPGGGEPIGTGFLGSSASAVALDTAVCGLLKLRPDEVPVWKECIRRNMPGSRPEDIIHAEPPAEARYRVAMDTVDCSGFEVPRDLDSASFHPLRLLVSGFRRLYALCKG